MRQRVHRAQQRDLGVERLAGPRGEGGRDAEQRAVRVLEDEGRAGRVPGRVAARLEGRADAAGREARMRRARPGSAPCRRTRRARCRRRLGRRRSRASRRSSRSAAGTVGVVGRAVLHRPVLHRLATASASAGRAPRRCSSVRWSCLKTSLGRRSLLDGEREDVGAEGLFAGWVRSSAPRASPFGLHCAAVTFSGRSCWSEWSAPSING